jgi:hypothetical protein
MNRIPWIFALALAAALASGCDRAQTDVLDEARGATFAARAKAPGDRYLALRGRKPAPGSGFVQAPPDTFAPFDVAVRTGLFDPERVATAEGVRACLELSSVGFDPFFDVCADYTAAGGGTWNVLAFHGPPVVFLTGSAALAGPEIELRTETDGATLRFHARAAGDPGWIPVAEMPWEDPGVALKPAVGATNLRKGTTIGFDEPVYASAPPPGPLDAAGQAAFDAQRCLVAGLGAFLALDRDPPDLAVAATALPTAAAAAADAVAAADALPPGRTRTKASALLRGVAKGLAKAEAHVDAGRGERALASLTKAGKKAVQASLLLSPQPAVSLR